MPSSDRDTSPIDVLKDEWSDPERADAYFRVVRSILDRLELQGKTILDLGCARGYSTCSYAAAGASHAIGLEVKRDRLRKSDAILETVPSLQGKVSFLQGTSSQIPLRDETLDGIIMNEALSHYQYPEVSLREAHRILKPGGKLYVFDDNNSLDVRGYFRRRLKRWPPYYDEYDSLRKEYIREEWGHQVENVMEWVKNARGLTFEEMRETLENDALDELPEPPHHAPRHPNHGAYAEREINPYQLLDVLKEVGYDPRLVPTEFSVTGWFGKLMNRLFQRTHPLSLYLAPGFTIIARKHDSTAG